MDDPMQCYRVSSTFRMLGSLPVEDVELYLTVCGTERCTADKFYGPIVRRDYHMHFILFGNGRKGIQASPWPDFCDSA